ncbi:hypothetical protein DFJ73DRAFT_19488 [Zopfochytrium polystomum]|nr:hypothetical protein DFJ73DRAFT_19488 [Zopfochytrium polystomum]
MQSIDNNLRPRFNARRGGGASRLFSDRGSRSEPYRRPPRSNPDEQWRHDLYDGPVEADPEIVARLGPAAGERPVHRHPATTQLASGDLRHRISPAAAVAGSADAAGAPRRPPRPAAGGGGGLLAGRIGFVKGAAPPGDSAAPRATAAASSSRAFSTALRSVTSAGPDSRQLRASMSSMDLDDGGGGGFHHHSQHHQSQHSHHHSIHQQTPAAAAAPGLSVIRISMLHPAASQEDVRACFEEFGPVVRCVLRKVEGKRGGADGSGSSSGGGGSLADGPTGVAEVSYESRKSALAAIEKYHNMLADGLQLQVVEVRGVSIAGGAAGGGAARGAGGSTSAASVVTGGLYADRLEQQQQQQQARRGGGGHSAVRAAGGSGSVGGRMFSDLAPLTPPSIFSRLG